MTGHEWVELGIAGAVLVFALVALLWVRLRRFDPQLPPRRWEP